MKIGIIDADLLDNGTRHPNLALLKISAFHKEKGDEVILLHSYEHINLYDHVFISKVFSFTNIPIDLTFYNNITFGGTGFYEDGGPNLDPEIEHHMPDYHLYDNFISEQLAKGISKNHYSDYLDYSIGFTTRGCNRRCKFCVNKKYKEVVKHSNLSEFLDLSRPKIYLWDDNILAFSNWEGILDDLEKTQKPFQFRQGMDIRLINDNIAKRLSRAKYAGDFIFAFDHIKDKKVIEEKLTIWKKHCKKTTKLYVLTGFDSQDEKDIINTFERIKVLMKFGCIPYIMRYEEYKNSEYKDMYIQIARWCNQPQFYKKKSFRQFCEANQEYHKNKNTICSSLKAMLIFQDKHPEIAQKYFDMRYDELNKYSTQSGNENDLKKE